MTNEKEAPEWWRKFITLATGGAYSYVRTEYIPSIVAEAERRGEMKALEEMVWNGMFPKNLPKSMENGYLACGMDLNEKIDAKLTSLKTP